MKHTTAEYLAWIDSELERYTKLLENVPRAESKQSWHYEASLLANRDVLVRHGREGMCNECSLVVFTENGVERCKTYLDIAQRLDEVM